MFNDFWMLDEGFAKRDATGTVRDLVTRRFDAGGTIVVGPADTLRTAFSRMRAADVSQLPVVDDGRVVGLIDESDILNAHRRRRRPRSRRRWPTPWCATSSPRSAASPDRRARPAVRARTASPSWSTASASSASSPAST